MASTEALSLVTVTTFVDGDLTAVAANVGHLLEWPTSRTDIVTDLDDVYGYDLDYRLHCNTIQLSPPPNTCDCARRPSLELMQLYDPVRRCPRAQRSRTMGALTLSSQDIDRTRQRLMRDGMPICNVDSEAKPGAFQAVYGGLVIEVVQEPV